MHRSLLVSTWLLLGAAGLAAAADGPNLIKNHSLEGELGANRFPEGWERYQAPKDSYRFEVVEGGHTGAKSLKVQGAGEYAVVAVGRVPVEANKQVAFRGWARVEGKPEASCIVKLDYLAENGEYLSSSAYDLSLHPGSKEWQAISAVSRLAEVPNAKFVSAALGVNGDCTAWFDDLELVVREASAPNLLRNGSMEEVAAGKPFGWQTYTSEGGKATLTWTDREPKDGWYALAAKGNAEWAVFGHPSLPVHAGKIYILTGSARTKGGSAMIKFDYFRDGEYLGSTSSDPVTEDTWTTLKVISDLAAYPQANRISAAGVGLGEFDARYDGLLLVAK
ncbi:MAG: pknB 13, partial [Armatimonadetes bacterium]|nr:pknB 13 [Armatimonadota bacterium]